MDWSPPGSSIHGILQARVLEWLAISPGIKAGSPTLLADALPSEPPVWATKWGKTEYLLKDYCPAPKYTSKGLHQVRPISMCLLAIYTCHLHTWMCLSNDLQIYETVFYHWNIFVIKLPCILDTINLSNLCTANIFLVHGLLMNIFICILILMKFTFFLLFGISCLLDV